MQDMEFTIEKGKLYMLQTRNGKRTLYTSGMISAIFAIGMGVRTPATTSSPCAFIRNSPISQDMEFTIKKGNLYMLQPRNGKRTAAAAIKIACDLIDEGMITEQEALMQLEPGEAAIPLPITSVLSAALRSFASNVG